MRPILRFTLLLSLVFAFTACQEDNAQTNLLSYDGPNITAPEFLPGEYQMAARFTPSETAEFRGKFLEEVEVYILNRPARAEIIIYGEGTATVPGPIRYSEVVTTDLRSQSWNTHILSTPVEIQDEDIWIAIMVRHTAANGSVGCDVGPANTNGDILLDDAQQWTNLRDFTNQAIDINWNIRGKVAD